MARTRLLKPGFFMNDLLLEIEPLGRLLFAGLWCHADREGRLEDRPKKFKINILPCDDCNIDELLNQLHARGFVRRYSVGEVAYIQIVSFDKHQKPHIKEAASTIPEYDEHLPRSVLAPTKDVASRAFSLNPSPLTLNPSPFSQRSETESKPPSDAEDAIRLIALTHPANIPPIRKKALEPTGVPVDQLQAIVEACTRDSPKLVLEGTQALALAVSYWPPERWRFVPNPVKFWRSAEYLKDPAVWEQYMTTEQVRDLKRKAEARIGSRPSQLPEKLEPEPEPDLPTPSVEDRIANCRAVIESANPDVIRLRMAQEFLSNVVATEGKSYAPVAPLIVEAKRLLAKISQSRRKPTGEK